MSLMVAARANPTLTLHRLLRRGSVARIVLILKIALGCVSFGLFALLAASLIEHLFLGNSEIAQLSEQVDRALAAKIDDPASKKVIAQDYSPIVKRNIFGDLGPIQAAQPVATPLPKPASSALSLVGVFISERGTSEAIIEHTKKSTQEVFSVGENVFDEAQVKKILPDRVELDRNGQSEWLILEEGLGESSGEGEAAPEDAEQIAVNEAELNTALENLPLLLTQARAVPYFKDGKAVGLRLFAIKTDSLYERVGLKNGDILKTINGNSLGDISQAMKLFETLKQERSLNLTVERNRQSKVFHYVIQ